MPPWSYKIFDQFHKTPAHEYNVSEDLANFYVNSVIVSKEQIKQLCEMTVSQGQSKVWRQERKLRVTASRGHKILRARSDHKRVEYFLDHKSLDHIKHVRRGIELEPVALQKYQELTQRDVTRVGLVVKEEQYWLAASPDGIYLNDHGEICVLEIKCPEHIDVSWLNESGQLKQKDPYYTQIQLTMYVCNANSANLFIYTVENYKIVDVPFDQKFC